MVSPVLEPVATDESDSPLMKSKKETSITRAELSQAVFREIGLSQRESSELVEFVLAQICDALLREEQVKLASFGTFYLRRREARTGRNPRSGELVAIPPCHVVGFKPSHILRRHVDIHADAGDEA